MYALSSRNEPFSYRLSARSIVSGVNPTIDIVLGRKAVETLGDLSKDTPVVRDFLKTNPKYWGDFKNSLEPGGNFGFCQGLFFKGCLVEEAHDDGLIIKVLTPKVVYPTTHLRRQLREEKISLDLPLEDGDRDTVSWNEAFATAATLHIIFSRLSLLYDYNSVCEEGPLQSLHVSTVVEVGMHGGSIGGAFSPFFTNWLGKNHKRIDIERINEVMRLTWHHMMPNPKYAKSEDRELHAEVRPLGTFLASCPGENNACIYPDQFSENDIENGRGYSFGCHNLDTPAQQFVLLAALAALSDQMEDCV